MDAQTVRQTRSRVRLIPCLRNGDLAELFSHVPRGISEACRGTAEMYKAVGFQPPWIGYVSAAGSSLVGGGAFVGQPKDGRVEIAYFTLPEHQREGFALETARELTRVAFAASRTINLYAKTLPEPNASTRILERLGFRRDGFAVDDDQGLVWAWLKAAEG